MRHSSFSKRAALLSILLLVCCISLACASAQQTYDISLLTSSLPDAPSSALPPPSPPLPSTTSRDALALTAAFSTSSSSSAAPTITSVSGCLNDTGVVTRACTMSSVLTITGSDLVFNSSATTALVISGSGSGSGGVSCPLSSQHFRSSSLIVAPLCPYYYPSVALLSLAVQLSSGVVTAPLQFALSFGNVGPVLSRVSGCSVPPYGSCNTLRPNRLTVTGSNFLSTPAFPRLYVVQTRPMLPCETVQSSITFTRFECVLNSFSWGGSGPLPSDPFSVVAYVQSPNWLESVIISNVLDGALSFVQYDASSSSAGGGPGPTPSSTASEPDPASSSTGEEPGPAIPYARQVSGCVDDGDWTAECPVHTLIELTVYGLYFQRAPPSIVISNAQRAAVPCTNVKIEADDTLRCDFNTSLIPLPLPAAMMDLNVISAQGTSVFPGSVGVTSVVELPLITMVRGCVDQGSTTRDCYFGSEVRIAGSHFPRWLEPHLIIGGQLQLACVWRGSEIWVFCPLDDSRVETLPKGQLLTVQVRFDERYSDTQLALSMRGTQPPTPAASSSSGQADGLEADDDLRGAKVTLFVFCVLALVAMLVGVGVWMMGVWTAHRRAFVSANAHAAVDMRQVLLH